MAQLAENIVWTTRSISEHLFQQDDDAAIKKAERWIYKHHLNFDPITSESLRDEHERPPKAQVLSQLIDTTRKKRHSVLFAELQSTREKRLILFANDGRQGRRWITLPPKINPDSIEKALRLLTEYENRDTLILPKGRLTTYARDLARNWRSNDLTIGNKTLHLAIEIYSHSHADITAQPHKTYKQKPSENLTHLDYLEAESIHIIREVIAQADNPVMLYSAGKDSSVMLHLARKAFYPSLPPFPLLHIDTRWKFQAMYDFRDYIAQTSGMDLIVHINPEGIRKNINPLDHAPAIHTNIMKTEGLKQALDHYKFDVAFGGARRDEEKSRAKERTFSFRTENHRWDPKNQRPELWHLYNGRKNTGESIRVFPLSNWTELDIWQYIYREQVPIAPLYLAAERPVVEREGMLIMVDDSRLILRPGEQIKIKKTRFRTLGCYPLTGAIESEADDLASIILEISNAKTSERQGRAIDSDSPAAMEKKKQEGYF